MVNSAFRIFIDQLQQLFLFVVLAFSVFLFSGYNHQLHAALNSPDQTELADSRASESVNHFSSFLKTSKHVCNYSVAVLPLSPLFSIRNARYFDQLQLVKFKVFKEKSLRFYSQNIYSRRIISYDSEDEDVLSFYQSNIH